MRLTEHEAEVVDALRFGPSPVTGIAERVQVDAEEVLDILLTLEQRTLVRRHRSPAPDIPATRSWWELTTAGYQDAATG